MKTATGVTVIRNGQLLPGTGAPPTADAVVIVRDGRIDYAGPAAAASPVTPGQTIDITAQTFVSGSTVTLTLNSEPAVLGTPTSDPSGVARQSATIPASTSLGAHTIVAQGTASDGTPLTLTVTARSP